MRELDCRLAARLREFYKSGKIRIKFTLIRIRSRENSFRRGWRRATFLREEGFGFAFR